MYRSIQPPRARCTKEQAAEEDEAEGQRLFSPSARSSLVMEENDEVGEERMGRWAPGSIGGIDRFESWEWVVVRYREGWCGFVGLGTWVFVSLLELLTDTDISVTAFTSARLHLDYFSITFFTGTCISFCCTTTAMLTSANS